ncbi:protein tyrosine phosphatase family protein [Sphingobium nicotianae]|uniref:Protein tyrosine phosphatase family protein n=1 Tax=Sphingobium nicotianae TaxID=2782607 RepID=A0A9X1DBI9_9SPHN|nr:protein tyrosine phosphatase family protein [Sphingobium nicotianae]MBT2187022.1 protein tyrosine phosphatase family protein [Sphingobium nicotianae]
MTDPDDLRNFVRLDDRITTSGRLQEGDPARLAAIGVRHVINLALDDHPEALPDAATHMAQAGLRYTHIPVPFDRPTDAHYRAFVAAIEEGDDPVHVHCIANFRVSAFFYRYHRDARGMDDAEARAIMERVWTPETIEIPHARVWAAFVAPKQAGETA